MLMELQGNAMLEAIDCVLLHSKPCASELRQRSQSCSVALSAMCVLARTSKKSTSYDNDEFPL